MKNSKKLKIPNSYAPALESAPTSSMPADLVKMQESRKKADAFSEEQRQLGIANLQRELNLKQAKIDKIVASKPEEEKKYPAFQYNAKRLKTINDLEFFRRVSDIDTIGMSDAQAERQRKLTEERLKPYEADIKPIEETSMWKAANENFRAMDRLNQRVSGISSLIGTAKSLFEEGKADMALEHMKTNVAKALNSLQSDDAIQMSEVLFRYRDLLSVPELNEMGGRSALDPMPYFNAYVKAKSANDQAGMAKSQQNLDQILEKMFTSNPKRFLQTAVNGANSYLNSYNDQLDNKVINVTSPRVAREMGAVKFNPITQLQEEPPPPIPATFPSFPLPAPGAVPPAGTVPPASGAMQPIQRPAIGGSPDQFQPQQPQQQEQPVPAPVAPPPEAPAEYQRDDPRHPINQLLQKYRPKP